MEIINLDMTPSTVTPNAHAGQYDSARTVRFMLKNGGVPFTLAGTETITAEITRSDNTEATVNVENTSSNYVDVVFDDTVCTVKGLYACELRIKDGDVDIGSKNFALLVQRDPYDGQGVSVETVGPADICTFETTLAEPLQSVVVDILATGGNGTPDNPIPINGYTEANIVNTQNDSIVDLFSIDSDFRGTVAFNQLSLKGVTTGSRNGITYNRDADGRFAVSGECDNTDGSWYPVNGATTIVGHAYYYAITGNTNVSIWQLGYLKQTEKTTAGVYKPVSTTQFGLYVHYGSGQINETVTPMLIDLTAMFGSTIADYIYSLEQATAGAGVAFFRSIYPDDYYAYDSGTTEIVGKETPEATIAFGQTVYGGVLDVTRGKLKPCIEYPSYNGETLSGRWLSSEATYAEGTTPPIGSQVVSLDDYGTDIDLTPEVISAVVGTNNVFADCGQTTAKYLKAE